MSRVALEDGAGQMAQAQRSQKPPWQLLEPNREIKTSWVERNEKIKPKLNRGSASSGLQHPDPGSSPGGHRELPLIDARSSLMRLNDGTAACWGQERWPWGREYFLFLRAFPGFQQAGNSLGRLHCRGWRRCGHTKGLKLHHSLTPSMPHPCLSFPSSHRIKFSI